MCRETYTITAFFIYRVSQRGEYAERRIESIDFSQLLGSVPAALIPVALVLYFSDQNTKKWMEERREIVLAILTERKEWLQERKDTIERQFAMQDRTVTEMASTRAENHALRNALQANTTRIEAMDLRIQAFGKRGSASD